MVLLSGGDDERSLGRARGCSENRSSDLSLPLRAWMTGGERGLILSLPGSGLRGDCCWTSLGAGSGPLVPALIHAGLVILRPRPAGGGISVERVEAVDDGIPSPRCTPLSSYCCNPPVARAGPLVPVLIRAEVVVRLPRPTGGRALAGRIVTIAVVLFSSCHAPIDSRCCSPPGAYAVSLVPVCIRAGGVVRRPRPTDGVTSAGSISVVVGGRKLSCCSLIRSYSCSLPVAKAAAPVPELINTEVCHLYTSPSPRDS